MALSFLTQMCKAFSCERVLDIIFILRHHTIGNVPKCWNEILPNAGTKCYQMPEQNVTKCRNEMLLNAGTKCYQMPEQFLKILS